MLPPSVVMVTSRPEYGRSNPRSMRVGLLTSVPATKQKSYSAESVLPGSSRPATTSSDPFGNSYDWRTRRVTGRRVSTGCLGPSSFSSVTSPDCVRLARVPRQNSPRHPG